MAAPSGSAIQIPRVISYRFISSPGQLLLVESTVTLLLWNTTPGGHSDLWEREFDEMPQRICLGNTSKMSGPLVESIGLVCATVWAGLESRGVSFGMARVGSIYPDTRTEGIFLVLITTSAQNERLA